MSSPKRPSSADASSQLPAMRAPMPSDEGYLNTQAKLSLADFAFALRDEQLQARIVHYREDLQTNAELDAITAQVVSELQALQSQASRQRSSEAPRRDRAQIEIELIQSLKEMLARLFRPDRLAPVFERRLGEVSKRFARLFFSSELHEKIAGSGDEQKTVRYPEQALYYVLARNEPQLLAALRGLPFSGQIVHDESVERLHGLIKELRSSFLSKTTPELNELMAILHEVLRAFLREELPPTVGELAWEVVKEGRLADGPRVHGYKISAAGFPAFRQAFERRFLQRLVPYVADRMLAKVREREGAFRIETQRFVASPTLFSEVCEVICEAIYDTLCVDGLLDLPIDWRQRLAAEG